MDFFLDKDCTLTSYLQGCLYWWADWGHICSCTAAWLPDADDPDTHLPAGRCASDIVPNASPGPDHTWQNTEHKKITWAGNIYIYCMYSSINTHITSPHGPVTHWGGGQRCRLQRTLEVGRPFLGHLDSGSVSPLSPLLHKTTRCL